MSAALLEAPELVSSSVKPLGKSRLEKVLAEYREAAEGLASYRGSAARAELSEQQALDDADSSEEKVAQEITRAQNLQNVFRSRIANRESKLAELEKELTAAVAEVSRELSGLVHIELQRRNELLIQRLCDVLCVTAQDVLPGQIHRLLGLSPLIKAVMACEAQNNAFVNSGTTLEHATNLLSRFVRFEAEKDKEF